MIFFQAHFPFLFLAMPVVLIQAFRLGSVAVALTMVAIAIVARSPPRTAWVRSDW